MIGDPKYTDLSISVIIPVYNEEESIIPALHTNKAILEKYLQQFEIILVNDGSTDMSRELINDDKNTNLYHRAVHKVTNEGMGSAVREGIPVCGFDYVLVIPVDNPLNDVSIVRFLENIADNDVVVGYRKFRQGYTARMRFNSWLYHAMISTIFRIKLKDYTWIHLYKRDIFNSGGITISSNGISMLPEILIKATRKGMKIAQVEIPQDERLVGTATASKVSTLLKTFQETMKLMGNVN